MKIKTISTLLLQNIVIVMGAFLAAFHFTTLFDEPTSLVGALWAVISAIMVLETTPAETFHAAKHRLTGSFLGALVSGIYLFFFPFTFFGFIAAIASGVLLCLLAGLPQSVKLTCITISVVMIVSANAKTLHPFTNAGLRFAESAIGTGVAVLVVLCTALLHKSRQKNDG